MVCYACNSVSSLRNIKSRWVPEIKKMDQKAPFILVGTKEDLYEKGDYEHVTAADAKRTAKQLGAYASLRCSALEYCKNGATEGDVTDVFSAGMKAGLLHIGVIQEETFLTKCCPLF